MHATMGMDETALPSLEKFHQTIISNNARTKLSTSDTKAEDGGMSPTSLDDSLAEYDLLTPTFSSTNSSPRSEISADGFGSSIDRLSVFEILDHLALPQRLERIQNAFQQTAEKLRRQRTKLLPPSIAGVSETAKSCKDADSLQEQQQQRYHQEVTKNVESLSKRLTAAKAAMMNDKITYVFTVLNVFTSGYIMAAWPHMFHYWYSAQLTFYMPRRWYHYHNIGEQYFLADLCYFINFLLVMSIWFFPDSKRLFISTYCLAFGNNAFAIAMWRNSLVFHSLDKVTSVFIHIMPCAALHTIVHLLPPDFQLSRFPAVHTIRYSSPTDPEHYSLTDMLIWATLPYAIWQVSYHFLITVRKRHRIAAGTPTSFTTLRKRYSRNFLGKFLLSFPEPWQGTVFMAIQYVYATLTMLPCPLWFWYSWASAGFMMVVFTWASWNGATYYTDYYGRRTERELNRLKQEVLRLQIEAQNGADIAQNTPDLLADQKGRVEKVEAFDFVPKGANGHVSTATRTKGDS